MSVYSDITMYIIITIIKEVSRMLVTECHTLK